MLTIFRLSSFLIGVTVPAGVYAQTSATSTSVSEIVGLFNIVVGLMFVCAFAMFVGGIISYVVYFGNPERLKGIKLMEWGVAVLFVLVVLLGIAQFFSGHGGVANILVAMIVIVAAVWAAVAVFIETSGEKEEKKP